MNNNEIMLTQLLTNWLGSDNIHFSEKAVFNQPVLLITYILNFLPMDSCGVCYRDNFRKKCRECVFVLCRECAGRLRNEVCPHCQRENMFPGFIVPETINFRRRSRRRRRNAVLFNNWTDNPFGPILLDIPPPPPPRLPLPVISPIVLPPPPPLPLPPPPSYPPPPPPLTPPPTPLTPPPPILTPPPPPSLPLLLENPCIRCGRAQTTSICDCYYSPWIINPGRHRSIWAWRESRSSLQLPLLAMHPNRCVCALRNTLNYVCPYGRGCYWAHNLPSVEELNDLL